MNDILKDVEVLKQKVMNSNEYNDFKKYEQILDSNKEVNDIIGMVEKLDVRVSDFDEK